MLERQESRPLQTSHERRLIRRFDMRMPATVNLADKPTDQWRIETQNVSARGVFFYLDRPIPEGCHIAVTLTFPPHVTLTDSLRVRFTGRVVRVEPPLPSSRVGIAAVIQEYEFLRPNLERGRSLEIAQTNNSDSASSQS